MEVKGLRRTVFTYKMDGGGVVAVWYRSLRDPHCAFRRLTVWSRSSLQERFAHTSRTEDLWSLLSRG